jgi:hypothetical protein
MVRHDETYFLVVDTCCNLTDYLFAFHQFAVVLQSPHGSCNVTHTCAPYRAVLQSHLEWRDRPRLRWPKPHRRCEAELLAQLGREASFAEQLLVRRIARLMLQAELFDRKLASSAGFTAHDSRTYSGMSNAIRVSLRDLGLKPQAKRPAPTLAEYAAQKAAST